MARGVGVAAAAVSALLALLAATTVIVITISPAASAAAAQDAEGWVEGRATWFEDNQRGACEWVSFFGFDRRAREKRERAHPLKRARPPSPKKKQINKHRFYASVPHFYAAFSDSNAPQDGNADNSCGQCYEVQCVPGTVVDRYGEQLSRWEACRGGAAGRDASSRTALVMVTDKCPCFHENYASNQRWCCGDSLPHIDLGAAAFGHLADPDKGVVRVRWRRADCSRGNGPVDSGGGAAADAAAAVVI